MIAIQKSNSLAYAELVTRYIDKLYGYLLRLTSNPADAEDLVQETFLQVWNKSTTYKIGRVRFSTWLFTIGHNKFVDQYRKNRGHSEDYHEQLFTDESMEELHQQVQWVEQLTQALNKLPENQRCAILLAHNQGFSNLEVATILGLSVRAVESILSRGRKTLRKLLTEKFTNDAY